MNMFLRSSLILGEDPVKKLNSKRVALFGVGGVGSFTLEALVRTGVGEIHIFDSDCVEETNLNRQIIATGDTLGLPKVEAAKRRAESINENVKIIPFKVFYSAENSSDFDLSQYDYIVDAIDSVPSKVELILSAQKSGTPIISSMGTGNKLNPLGFKIADIYKTEGCPLARVMRAQLKKSGVKKLKCLYSDETPIKNQSGNVGSIVTVTGAAGLIIANEVIKDLLDK
ncbi:MAG: tRNA threonylcarbamoyladenosine dehydratase [Clostridia bacterium]|nr:tRNA threonylcarbamoyladenosine dehydratase [Clostridia bacterium]